MCISVRKVAGWLDQGCRCGSAILLLDFAMFSALDVLFSAQGGRLAEPGL
jgi:hypothetical protein